MSNRQTQIVILGAGYAGMMAAVRLAGKLKGRPATITLVNGKEFFVERPKLHETATGRIPNARAISDMLAGTGVNFQCGWVTAIDPREQTVAVHCVDEDVSLRYDYLIYSLGSRVNRGSVPGVAGNAYTPDGVGRLAATELFCALENLPPGGCVTVAGSGPTGIELAAEIADRYGQLHVTMVTRHAFATFTAPRVANYMRKALDRLGVHVREHAEVTDVHHAESVINGQESLTHDLFVWAGGFVAPALAAESGLAVNERNQVLTDLTLRSLSWPNILATGDAVCPDQQSGAPMRMSLFTALVTGAHAADNVARMIAGDPPQPLVFSTYGQGIALGTRDAVGFNTFPNDWPVGPLVTGRAGLAIRNFFVWLILWLLDVERRRPGFFFWFGRKRGRPAEPVARGRALTKHPASDAG